MASPPKLDDLSFLKEIPDLPREGRAAPHQPAAGSSFDTPGALPLGGVPLGAVGMGSVPPTRAQLRRRWGQALLLSGAWMGGHLAVYGVRQDLGSLPLSYVLVQIAAPLGVGALSLLLAASPGRFGLGVAVGTVGALAVMGPLSFLLAALGMPAPLFPSNRATADHALCLDLTLLWMSVPLLLFAFHLRRGFPSSARFRSALVGAACGLLAGGMMNLHCSSVEQVHMVLGHAIPVGIGALLGAFVFSRWLQA